MGLGSLRFRHPFRNYQRMILAHVESGAGQHRKHHIVAPPGSGKTIVGLELVRRFGDPAVIFAPTTTIQQQWREEVRLFTGGSLDGLVSMDAASLSEINVFTYQLISTPADSRNFLGEAAVEMWVEELLLGDRVPDEDAARARISTLRENNPRAYSREAGKRRLRARRELLRGEDPDVARFLHPNARRLIEDLVARGVRTVVLDECHHLLDYWAIVLRHLIERIEEPRVVGLTATLPSVEDGREYENYTTLLGDVDFEVPTPAVVKEGDLAPYRDLAYFTEPTPRETRYLRNIQREFEREISGLTDSVRFRKWVAGVSCADEDPQHPKVEPGEAARDGFEEFLRREPVFSLAALRFLRRIEYPVSAGLPVPREADEPLTVEDWGALLERYGLDRLRLSPDEEDHRALARLRRVLLPFGLTLTETGLRASRSPGDLVLAFSESKDEAACRILAAESAALCERLRAIVVTDFERVSFAARPEEALDRDAGSALRIFGRLVADPEAGRLDPILVTGRIVLVDADHGPGLIDRFNDHLERAGLRATCRYRETGEPGILEVAGDGPDWSSRAYVAMVTAAFEEGVTRCLVGTRGILGEGWDSLSLNTLVDLTSVTTSTSVQQLRGRSIRKHPSWPRKVAHNWDVVCVARDFDRGDADLRRFSKRHGRFWGIEPPVASALSSAAGTLSGGVLGERRETQRARVVRGVSHVDPALAADLAYDGFERTDFRWHTRYALAQVGDREESYELWGVGEEYSNFSFPASHIQTKDLRFRTVHTLRDSLRRMILEFRASLVVAFALVFFEAFGAGFRQAIIGGGSAGRALFLSITVAMVLALAGTVLFNLRSAYRLGKALLVEQRPDAILLDLGRALLAALRDASLVSGNLLAEYVRVAEREDGSHEVMLDYASPRDAGTFVEAYRQMLAPVRDQRYLILRDEDRLPSFLLGTIWATLRPFFRARTDYPPAYHPVPDALATRRERAEALARHWTRYVGGGRLVYTRGDEGRRVLIKARAQRCPDPKTLAFEVWR